MEIVHTEREKREKGKLMSVRKTSASAMRRGFTLVELLVVIAIIGVLVGLLMPAIVNARLTALQTTCANNQRELAMAMVAYDSNKDRLPYVGRQGNSYSTWYVQILEELGMGKIQDDLMNSNYQTTPVKQFKCPAGDAAANGFSYQANVGNPSYYGSDYKSGTTNPSKRVRGSGLLFYYYGKGKSYTKSSISSIHDGASYTILISEKCYKKAPGGSNLSTDYRPSDRWDSTGSADHAYKHFGLNWNGSSAQTDFSNYVSSRHSQVNNFAFADGSVRALNKAIHYTTFCSLMCPDDNGAGHSWNLATDPNYKQ